MEFQLSCFKCCESATLNKLANLENSAVATGLQKISFHSNPKERQCQKHSNYDTITLISHTSKVILKILQAKFQQYVRQKHPDVQAGFRKGRGTRDQIANICWIIEKAREFHKIIYFCFIDYTKAFDSVDHNTLENSSRDGNTRPPDLPPEKPVCRSRSNNRTRHGARAWFKIGKGVRVLSPCLFNLSAGYLVKCQTG